MFLQRSRRLAIVLRTFAIAWTFTACIDNAFDFTEVPAQVEPSPQLAAQDSVDPLALPGLTGLDAPSDTADLMNAAALMDAADLTDAADLSGAAPRSTNTTTS